MRSVVDDVYIRNVPTDIRNGGAMEADGNSIFIFEVAGLCIGHLGHLHHGWRMPTMPRSAGSTSSWCRSTAA